MHAEQELGWVGSCRVCSDRVMLARPCLSNLTMHGITREITLDVVIQGTDTDPWGNTRTGLEIVGKLLRSQFDMKFSQALGSGNMLVGDKVGLALDISAVLEE